LYKARVGSKHEVLEIGCGWGSLAIELVKRTGCRYTGITLSKEQLKYAKQKVKEAGLEVIINGSFFKMLIDCMQQFSI
jgi:cyclopropane-fatty-acyl-phospholipid synthase